EALGVRQELAMIKPNHLAAGKAVITLLFALVHHRSGLPEPGRRHRVSRCLLTLLLSVALVATGCHREKLGTGFHRAGSNEFSADETKAVEIAKAYLEKSHGKRIDARYKVTRVPEGFSVHAEYVTGYQNGQPFFLPGGFSVVLVSTQWTVLKIIGGV